MNWPGETKHTKRLDSQAGLTLVELLVALAIAVFIGFVIFELLSSSMGDWSRTAADSNAMADANIALSRLGQDIRQAQNPNQHTKPVVVGSDHTYLDVYRNDNAKNTYQRICYMVEETTLDGKTLYRLKRGVVETSDPGSDENPQYGTINNWQILLEGLNSKAVFNDLTGNTGSDRRLIEISLNLSDFKNPVPKFTNFQIKTSLMSRSQQLNALPGEGGSSTIAVIGVTVNPTTIDNVSKDGTVFTAAAQIIPSNATNQNVSWTKSVDWLVIDNPSSASIQVTVLHHGGWFKRTGYLTVTTEDGGFKATITVVQNGIWSW